MIERGLSVLIGVAVALLLVVIVWPHAAATSKVVAPTITLPTQQHSGIGTNAATVADSYNCTANVGTSQLDR
jgi:hypothetical protein